WRTWVRQLARRPRRWLLQRPEPAAAEAVVPDPGRQAVATTARQGTRTESVLTSSGHKRSVDVGNEIALGDRCLVVVRVLLRPVRQLDLRLVDFLVRNQLQEMRDDVETRALLVIGTDEVPRRVFGVGRLEHRITRNRVLVPLLA